VDFLLEPLVIFSFESPRLGGDGVDIFYMGVGVVVSFYVLASAFSGDGFVPADSKVEVIISANQSPRIPFLLIDRAYGQPYSMESCIFPLTLRSNMYTQLNGMYPDRNLQSLS